MIRLTCRFCLRPWIKAQMWPSDRVTLRAGGSTTEAGVAFLAAAPIFSPRKSLRLPIAEYTNSLRAARLDRVPEGLVESIQNESYGFFLICAVRFVRAA